MFSFPSTSIFSDARYCVELGPPQLLTKDTKVAKEVSINATDKAKSSEKQRCGLEDFYIYWTIPHYVKCDIPYCC